MNNDELKHWKQKHWDLYQLYDKELTKLEEENRYIKHLVVQAERKDMKINELITSAMNEYDEEIKALKDENKRLKETLKKIEKENIGLRLSLASYELM